MIQVIQFFVGIIAFLKALFWSYAASAALAQLWADYLGLQNEVRIAFFIVFGCIVVFCLYGFFERDFRFSKICTFGTIAITGSCIGAFFYFNQPIELTISTSIHGAGLFLSIYLFVKKIDYLHRYIVLFLSMCFGAAIGSSLYYFFNLFGFIFIGGGMGFVVAVVYFFEEED
ncbi:hypothetical protein [Candidatus Uabimicrobium sp. HlEnr_7]|uniref:hypothetical protein n=1 Tax=Candidatus Uabimicrobium helgolandensis TaxID=3095367 RepID=UPI003557332A